MSTRRVCVLALLCVAAATAATAGAASPTFSAHVDNPWFPLQPGTRWIYTGVKDGIPSRDVVTVTDLTKRLAGAPCVAVHDRLYLHGRLEERTTDWYTQDAKGNVWYFGEDTAELDRRGHVTSTEGTWAAGENGARPGLFMPAEPRVGQTGRQEYLKGHAEDHFKVVSLLRTGAGKPNAVLMQEWTPLEPGVIDHKLYVRGIGTVLEQTEKGGNERNELLSVSRA